MFTVNAVLNVVSRCSPCSGRISPGEGWGVVFQHEAGIESALRHWDAALGYCRRLQERLKAHGPRRCP